MPAILFGSISTVADTSELQRSAFNSAFEAHGVGWHWTRDEYLGLLEQSGGQARIAEYARARQEQVDAAAVHATKSELFRKALAESPEPPRPGVAEVIGAAKDGSFKVALVTTTSPDNVAALIKALGPTIQPGDFDVVVDSSSVARPKPDAAAYTYALDALGERPETCVAIEDNLDGVESAHAAGLRCVAFPNKNTAGHSFDGADRLVDRLDLASLRQLITVS